MAFFHFEIDASATYSLTAPTLEVLVDGIVVSSAQITEHTGSGLDYLRFELEYSGTYPGTLQFRFNDGGEGGRNIVIDAVRVNGWLVDTTYISMMTLLNGQTSSVSTAAVDHLFGRTPPVLGDLPAETMTGTTGDDRLIGGSQPEIINAGNGADRVRGRDDSDAVFGGGGNDTIYGGGGNDIVVADDGDDFLYGEAGNDLLHGGDGNDVINGGLGHDLLNGGLGADYLIGEGGDDILYGEDGNDTLNGGAGNDFLMGDGGADIVFGGAGNDTVYGGLDQDELYGGAGDDVMYGEGGDDLIFGGAGGDSLYGNNGVDNIAGGLGNDIIEGNDGDDTVNGDAGNDTIDGGAGNDTLDGGADNDTLTYTTASSAITVSLAVSGAQTTGGAGTDVIVNFENLTGSDYNDKLTGSGGANTIVAGLGDDIVEGGAGNDTLQGGGGTDTLVYTSASAAVNVNLLTGAVTGGAGSDAVSQFENVLGSSYNDTLTGDGGNNILSGAAGSDTLNGDDGNDTLYAVSTGVTVFSTNFNSGTESFTYADNTFGGTGGAYVSGSRNTADGVNGNGCLEVFFDGTNATAQGTMSGAHTRSFTVSQEVAEAVATFQYKVIRAGTYETNEDTYVYVEVDGVKFGLNSNNYITRMESDGGDPTYDTGWRSVTLNLGTLAQGNHTISLGGLVEGKDNANEDSTIRFDNIYIGTAVVTDDAYSNALNGGNGTDTLYGSAGTDSLNGGAGDDILYSASVASVTSASILAAYSGVAYNATTNSFYRYVTTTRTWEAANSAATADLINGVSGHLAHSNSATENSYLDTLSGSSNIWLGGSDGAVNGEWRWIGGPNDGTQFWQGQSGGSAVGGAYTNWNTNEPNDYNGFEANIEMYNGGRWNDQLPGTTRAYVVEWEASQILVTGNTTTLAGGDGLDTLYGGAGADIFLFEAANAYNDTDAINGFDYVDGDKLDLSDLLSGYDSLTENLADFVMVSDGTATDSYMAAMKNYDALLYYRLGETSGGTAADTMGVLNGSYINTPTLNVADFNGGLSNNAVEFNGTNEYVRINDNAVFDLGAATFMAWFRSDTNSATQQTVMSKDGSSGGQFQIGVTTDDGDIVGLLQNGGGAAINFDIDQSVALNTWYHLAISFSTSSGVEVYLNGSSIYTNASFTTALGSNYDFLIGAENRGGNNTVSRYFNGRIDEVTVFNYKMGDQTIANIYNAGVNATDGAVADGVYVDMAGTGDFDSGSRIADFTGSTAVLNTLDMLSGGYIVT
ncbi:MAG: type I secretion C-terminal target domain-containing protein [Micavibrio aeruginosavorus]|uniref:Type I secretion C-terminal target domain-containing protein n=1 Tax=Micavibrio aeruginosavorus TaxID=349221 RepID=A0A7T5UI84_9BACT|nr:MAG: type I secretion C-terminal target domain-containing protein [Micavibrio aeruginosavorus]